MIRPVTVRVYARVCKCTSIVCICKCVVLCCVCVMLCVCVYMHVCGKIAYCFVHTRGMGKESTRKRSCALFAQHRENHKAHGDRTEPDPQLQGLPPAGHECVQSGSDQLQPYKVKQVNPSLGDSATRCNPHSSFTTDFSTTQHC